MARLDEHRTVRAVVQRLATQPVAPVPRLALDELRRLCLEAGADDCGVIGIGRAELDGQRDDLQRYFPPVRTLVSFVCRMNREPIRSPARSVANLEFHHTGHRVDDVAHRIVAALESRGIRAVNPAMGFPMEMDRFPSKIWVVAHKPVAEAAGLGRMGIHRNVIHPRFGNFILLGTVLTDAEVDGESQPIDYSPCLECKLCVATCPVGAISPDGRFNFSACYTHNYREFMGGFTEWVETVATSRSAAQYRRRVSDAESASMWQSLSYGANYKAAYCLAVCPAGEDVIGPFLADRKDYLHDIVRPLQHKPETVYVLPGSDAEDHVRQRFPHKSLKRVGTVLRPTSAQGFLDGMSLLFQPEKSAGLNARFHFTFTGAESLRATVRIHDQELHVEPVHVGHADLQVMADAAAWLRFIRKETGIVWLLLRRQVKLRGNPGLLLRFGRCFP